MYDREMLERTIIRHQRREDGTCLCGWKALGASHAAHVLDEYETYIQRYAMTALN